MELVLLFVASMVVKVLISEILLRLGLESGNAGQPWLQKMLRKNPLKWTIDAVVWGPIMEEATCRVLPSLYSTSWWIGLAQAVVFAAMHGLKTKDGKRVWPIQLVISGLVLWYVCVAYGPTAAILFHAAGNGLVVGLALLAIRYRPAFMEVFKRIHKRNPEEARKLWRKARPLLGKRALHEPNVD